MTNAMDRIFTDFKDADPTSGGGGGDYITGSGEHVVEIKQIKFKESDTDSRVWFVVEFTVLETTSESVKKGEVYAWVHDMTNKFFGASHVKQFIAAAIGFEPKSQEAKDIGRDTVEEAWAEDQPFTGEKVNLETRNKKTKAGHDFTVHSWTPAG